MNENYHDCHHRKTTRMFISTKSKKNGPTFLYTKTQTLFKKLDNFRYVFMYKKPYTLRYGIFMKFLQLAFIYKKHDTFRCVTFLTSKSQTLRKKQDNLRYVFKYKNPALCITQFFIEILKFADEGAFIYLKKHRFELHFILKNKALCVTLLYTKSLT